MKTNKSRRCLHSDSCICNHGHLTEEVLLLVFESQNWNPFLIADIAPVCRWFSELVKKHLWKLFCFSRGPKMVSELTSGSRPVIEGGWDALGRLMIYCAGESQEITTHGVSAREMLPREVSTRGTSVNLRVGPHFVRTTRFSKTSGRSFLVPECRSDVLYISDPCEHQGKNNNNSSGGGDEDDIGFFRGVFRDFLNSATRKLLLELGVKLEAKDIFCPYCFNRVWSLLRANMIPKSAHRRLAAHGDVKYFVCLNGHLYGSCSLMHLSDSDVSSD